MLDDEGQPERNELNVDDYIKYATDGVFDTPEDEPYDEEESGTEEEGSPRQHPRRTQHRPPCPVRSFDTCFLHSLDVCKCREVEKKWSSSSKSDASDVAQKPSRKGFSQDQKISNPSLSRYRQPSFNARVARKATMAQRPTCASTGKGIAYATHNRARYGRSSLTASS